MDVYEEWDVKYVLTLNKDEMKTLQRLVENGKDAMTEATGRSQPLTEEIKLAGRIKGIEVRVIPIKPNREQV